MKEYPQPGERASEGDWERGTGTENEKENEK